MVKGDGKAKRGRPALDVKMTRMVQVRISPELLERVEAAARAEGVGTSTWLRLAAAAFVDAPGDMTRAIMVDPSAERTRLVARVRAHSAKRAGDGTAA